jgi:hypothetical protein
MNMGIRRFYGEALLGVAVPEAAVVGVADDVGLGVNVICCK